LNAGVGRYTQSKSVRVRVSEVIALIESRMSNEKKKNQMKKRKNGKIMEREKKNNINLSLSLE
jgi:hypothetical protein